MKRTILSAILLLLTAVLSQAQNITVHGTVVSATDDEPLLGASVICGIEGPTNGVATDIDGRYSLKVPASAKQLLFSYVGYHNLTAGITSDVVDVTLHPDNEILDEVVVIG